MVTNTRWLGIVVRLGAISLLAGGGSWLLIPERSVLRATPAAVVERATSAAVVAPTWTRQLTLRDLMKPTSYVVVGAVVGIDPYTPITWQDAGSAEGAPAIPRQVATVRLAQQPFGAKLGAEIKVIQELAPAGGIFEEDPPYRIGDDLTLFLRDGRGPRARSIPGTFSRVGVDGTFRRTKENRLISAIRGAPVDEVAAALTRPEAFAEAKP